MESGTSLGSEVESGLVFTPTISERLLPLSRAEVLFPARRPCWKLSAAVPHGQSMPASHVVQGCFCRVSMNRAGKHGYLPGTIDKGPCPHHLLRLKCPFTPVAQYNNRDSHRVRRAAVLNQNRPSNRSFVGSNRSAVARYLKRFFWLLLTGSVFVEQLQGSICPALSSLDLLAITDTRPAHENCDREEPPHHERTIAAVRRN